MLVSDKLIVTHVSLLDAVVAVKREKVLDVIKLTADVLPKLRASSRIAVAGLNPHASENGAFGDEDLAEVRPAVQAARAAGIDVSGPFPSDTVFLDALKGRARSGRLHVP